MVTRGENSSHVFANVLRRNPHGNFLRALERPRGIERLALRARPKVGPQRLQRESAATAS
jgi:hypothetical protein